MSETSSFSGGLKAVLVVLFLLLPLQGRIAAQTSAPEGARIDLLALPLPAVAGIAEIVVVVEVSGADLLAEADTNALDGSLTLRLAAGSGERIAEFEQPFALTLNGRIESFRSSGLRYFASFPEVASGSYRLEATVQAQGGAVSGASATDVDVAAEGKPFVWPPLVAASSRGWLSYAQSVGPGAERAGAYPFVRGDGTQFVPAVRAMVPEGVPASVEVFGFGGAGLADVALRIAPSDSTAEPASESVVEFAADAMASVFDGVHRQAVLRLGDATDGDKVLLALHPHAGAEPLTLQLEVGGTSDVGPAVAQDPELAQAALEPVEVDANVKKAVEQVLDVLAQGAVTDAVQMVLGMSSDLLAEEDLSPRKRRALSTQVRKQRAAWMAAARDIGKAEPLALLPVVLLHKKVTDHYAQLGSMWIGAQSVMTQRDIANLYIDHLPSTTRAVEGADLRSVLGDYHGALELHPDHQFSLLKISLGNEQRGDWKSAASTLRHLSRLRPEDDEVWLRLALNLARSERVGEARGTLLSILDRPRVEYRVAILAFQELARLESSQGNLRRAVSVLERGLELYPENQRLRLELGLTYEKLGRRRDAERQLNRIRPALPPAVETARSWYAHGPQDEIRNASRQFVESASRHFSRLASLRRSADGAQ